MPRIYYSQMLYNKMASRARNHLSNFHEQTASRPSTSPILSSRPPPSGFFFFFFETWLNGFSGSVDFDTSTEESAPYLSHPADLVRRDIIIIITDDDDDDEERRDFSLKDVFGRLPGRFIH